MAPPPIPELLAPLRPELGFSVSHQRVDLEFELLSRSLKGRTEITVNPHSRDLKEIRLNCRQIELRRLSINGKATGSIKYEDVYKKSRLPFRAGVRQYHMLQERLEKSMRDHPEQELTFSVPKSVRIEELDPSSEDAQSLLLSKSIANSKRGSDASPTELAQGTRLDVDQSSRFTPITVYMEYEIERIRDGMQFVGLEAGDLRYPHAFTLNSSLPGTSCCLFPCIDDLAARCTWEISIKTPRTIGDILNGTSSVVANSANEFHGADAHAEVEAFGEADKAIELRVLCSGELTDEIVDQRTPSLKTTSFICPKEISAQHLGFAIGAFEGVDLSVFRGGDEDDRLGQNAISVHAYCTPGRAEEVKNTCFPITQAIDFNTIQFGSFPYSNYGLCFVDDAPCEVLHTATLSLCSTRLLFPKDVLEQIEPVTRTIVHGLATQWIGIDIVPKSPQDIWAIVGMAYFMTDIFMRRLCGKNDYRYRQKLAADSIVQLDVHRPSLIEMGAILQFDPSQLEFMALKAPLVLFILDQRILKGGTSLGLSRIISRILLNAKVGDIPNGELDTAYFTKTCEKLAHAKLEQFFAQWVEGAGCPKFRVTQRFNKKKLVVEMTIKQVQNENVNDGALNPNVFMRDVREEQRAVYAGTFQSAFTGPMTIRIHEADGTPYEHIVHIKEDMHKLDIPYNTKYKRLKRNRRQKERTGKTGDAEYAGDDSGDMLLYSLGDTLQSEDEVRSWKLADFSKEDEESMSGESYEWIRIDADFEWICGVQLLMPGYMFVSQLQQDRDVVAQHESIAFLANQNGHPLVSTFLIRTLMDSRYFHGIRTAAIEALAKNAREETDYIGLFHLEKAFQEFFCYPKSTMTRPNDFSDRPAHLVQSAIPQAVANVRNPEGKSIFRVRRWLLDKLKYNDNSSNDFSDAHYIAILMRSLAQAMSVRPPFAELDDLDDPGEDDIRFERACLEEIDRYRRVDEWIPSYHNIISRAALDCKHLLVKSKIIRHNPVDFLQYTSDFTSSLLRVVALKHLMDLKLSNNPSILRFFLIVLGTDPSPYIRDQLILLLGRTLGAIAIGTDVDPGPSPVNTGDLVIEQDISTDVRKADHARKNTVVGALDALKVELGSNKTLQEGLWSAITSPTISLRQMWRLLEFCDKLYIPHTSMLIVLKTPRHWTCQKTGKGKVVFRKNGSLRKPPEKKAPLKLRLSSGVGGGGALATQIVSPTPDPPIKVEPGRQESSSSAPRAFLKPPKPPVEIQASTGSVGSVGTPGPGLPEGEGRPKMMLKLKLKPKGDGGAKLSGVGSPS